MKEKRVKKGFQKFPAQRIEQERFEFSFQLAKFLSQLIASRRRKTPVHSDGEERKKEMEMEGGQEDNL